ncbi:MAG TPA: hypothetical protein VEL11_12315 [Candidatus Bathyarchaeia archaeon]|nr:hypothetical protein [Candidatus Bathyarchaeia archaeon]
MNNSLKESDRRVDPNIIDSAQSSHLKNSSTNLSYEFKIEEEIPTR